MKITKSSAYAGDGEKMMATIVFSEMPRATCSIVKPAAAHEKKWGRGLPIGFFTHLYVSCKLRGRGVGGALVLQALELADDRGWDLITCAQPFYHKGPSKSRLEQWYRGFGFRSTPSEPGWMIRRVK